jgi:hypothetical protein
LHLNQIIFVCHEEDISEHAHRSDACERTPRHPSLERA